MKIIRVMVFMMIFREMEEYMRSLFLIAAASLVLGGTYVRAQQNKNVTVINDTRNTLVEFYASHKSATGWGRDLLNSAVINSGSKFTFNVDDGTNRCMYDFKAVFDRGNDVESFDFNVCNRGSWHLVPGR